MSEKTVGKGDIAHKMALYRLEATALITKIFLKKKMELEIPATQKNTQRGIFPRKEIMQAWMEMQSDWLWQVRSSPSEDPAWRQY